MLSDSWSGSVPPNGRASYVTISASVSLRSLADRFGERPPEADATLRLEPGEGEELPERARPALFRVAQEAINNAAQHTGSEAACRLMVELGYTDGKPVLAVRDDGSGFEVPDRFETLAEEGHFGLLGMAERIEVLGGELSVRSAPAEGTEVTARVPPLPETARPATASQP